MIIANPPKTRKYSLAFTVQKYVPEEFILNPLIPVKVKAKINGKDCTILIEDIHVKSFDALQLIETLIMAGTDQNVETIRNGLVQRYGPAIKTANIYVVLFKVVE